MLAACICVVHTLNHVKAAQTCAAKNTNKIMLLATCGWWCTCMHMPTACNDPRLQLNHCSDNPAEPREDHSLKSQGHMPAIQW